ncbi:MAG: hypothetical protein JRG73_19490 [Deltaproteobacteria bacterium]|nr:hypothetical protein [Deltaproteobacteria bacterium]MBW2309112.1 hypothetical protein [Deltaproteobacteria bacterium]
MGKDGPTGKTAFFAVLVLTGFLLSWIGSAWGTPGNSFMDPGQHVAGESLIQPRGFSNSSPASDITVPTVIITSPVAEARVSGIIEVTVAATDDVSVSKVEMYIDGAMYADITQTHSFDWDTTRHADGPRDLVAVAYDSSGNLGFSNHVTVYVSNSADTTESAVSIISPADGSYAERSVRISAAASDNVGFSRIEHRIDGVCGNQVCDPGENEHNCREDCEKIRNIDYWTYTDFQVLSDEEIRAFCDMTPAEREEYDNEKIAEAQALSDRLETYIRNWYYGNASPQIPINILPSSIDNDKTRNWRLLRPEEVDPARQWGVRPAHEIPTDFNRLYFLSPDNHVTYMKLFFIAPFDSQLLIEGDFAHARFMDYQILAPFDPQNPTTSGMGAPEVPIVDVDIEPDPGHTNPFRPGADRNAENRHYHLTFDLKAGNAVELNPEAMIAPAYRAPGNTRVGGPFAFSGPNGNGSIIASVLWLRYYAPDKDRGPLGGVGYPKALLRLETGETFWIQPDFSLAERRQNTAVPGYRTWSAEPEELIGPNVGWGKMFGFWLTFADGVAYPWVNPWGVFPKSWAEEEIQSRDACYFGRGPNMAPPGNYETSASGMNYNTYLYRVVWLGGGKVYALTGKLPTTPKTRDGEPIATTGEARYWSICHTGKGEGEKYPGLLYGCLMDDEIETDTNNKYIIVYSRGHQRPWNATEECGVTWQNFGLESKQVLNIRWMSVMPDDYLPQHAPHQNNIPWETGEWSSPSWDINIMGYNNQNGFMKEYQPLMHYFSKEEFETLGCPVRAEDIPEWN